MTNTCMTFDCSLILYLRNINKSSKPNLCSMAGVTDIADWTWNESGINYTWLHPTPETLTAMWNMSPISHIESVKAPIFLKIGMKLLHEHSNVSLSPTLRFDFIALNI